MYDIVRKLSRVGVSVILFKEIAVPVSGTITLYCKNGAKVNCSCAPDNSMLSCLHKDESLSMLMCYIPLMW